MSGKNTANSVKGNGIRNIFYGTLACLIVLNSYLISSPNLIGKMGLMYYQYTYLRSFPRVLVTLTLLSAAAIAIDAMFHWIVKGQKGSNWLLIIFYSAIVLVIVTLFISLSLDVRSFAYRHTGFRFIAGILMIPWLLIFIFVFRAYITYRQLRRPQRAAPPDVDDLPASESNSTVH